VRPAAWFTIAPWVNTAALTPADTFVATVDVTVFPVESVTVFPSSEDESLEDESFCVVLLSCILILRRFIVIGIIGLFTFPVLYLHVIVAEILPATSVEVIMGLRIVLAVSVVTTLPASSVYCKIEM
jgi:hypothetical protein